MLEQPFGLISLGALLRDYADAFRIYDQDPDHAPKSVRKLVLEVARLSAEMRMASS